MRLVTRGGPPTGINNMTADHVEATLIGKANARLVQFDVTGALHLYTELLDGEAPAHPCALINRAACYFLLDLPELAAVDAYRTIHAAQVAKQDINNAYALRVETYIGLSRAERIRRTSWAIAPTCQIGKGEIQWLKHELTSVAVITTPAPEQEHGAYAEFCNCLVMKAYYWLALSLRKLGGGALRSALDVAGEAMHKTARLLPTEGAAFKSLESDILKQIAEQIQYERRLRPQDSDSDEPTLFQRLLMSRWTQIPTRFYPWDPLWKRHGHYTSLEHIRKTLQGGDPFVIAVVDDDEPEFFSLQATRDISEKQEIFNITSNYHTKGWSRSQGKIICGGCGVDLDATAEAIDVAVENAKAFALAIAVPSGVSTPKYNVPEDPDVPDSGVDIKATQVSERIITPANDRPPPISSGASHHKRQNAQALSTEALAVLEAEAPTETSEDDHPYIGKDNLRELEDHRHAPEGFQVCPGCLFEPWCSADCRNRALATYHADTCNTMAEETLRNYITTVDFPGLPEPRRQMINQGMLLRLLCASKNSRSLLSELADTQMLNVRLDAPKPLLTDPRAIRQLIRDPSANAARPLSEVFPDVYDGLNLPRLTPSHQLTTTLRPWSYENNVTKPLNTAYSISGANLALHTKILDGWSINTLLSRIDANVLVTAGPRFERIADDDGLSWLCQNVVRPIPLTKEQLRKKAQAEEVDALPGWDPQFWMGSLYPLASMIPIAGEGEKPNVELWEREGRLICRAIRADDGKEGEPVIRAGEKLLRGPYTRLLERRSDSLASASSSMISLEGVKLEEDGEDEFDGGVGNYLPDGRSVLGAGVAREGEPVDVKMEDVDGLEM